MSTASTAVKTGPATTPNFRLRPSGERGQNDLGWLKTYHTWTFADYYDPSHESFGSLRVLNEDHVEPGTGFGKHGHREFEIFSYLLNGELEHQDSLNNLEIMRRGDVQMTSTGTGVRHSEYNRNTKSPVTFLQIWAIPNQRGLKPAYYNRHYSDAEKHNHLVKIVAPIGTEGVIDQRDASGPTPIHADVTVHASILAPSNIVALPLSSNTIKVYVHNTMKSGYRDPSKPSPSDGSSLKVSDGSRFVTLSEGDGTYIDSISPGVKLTFESSGSKDAEFLIFEMSS